MLSFNFLKMTTNMIQFEQLITNYKNFYSKNWVKMSTNNLNVYKNKR